LKRRRVPPGRQFRDVNNVYIRGCYKILTGKNALYKYLIVPLYLLLTTVVLSRSYLRFARPYVSFWSRTARYATIIPVDRQLSVLFLSFVSIVWNELGHFFVITFLGTTFPRANLDENPYRTNGINRRSAVYDCFRQFVNDGGTNHCWPRIILGGFRFRETSFRACRRSRDGLRHTQNANKNIRQSPPGACVVNSTQLRRLLLSPLHLPYYRKYWRRCTANMSAYSLRTTVIFPTVFRTTPLPQAKNGSAHGPWRIRRLVRVSGPKFTDD